MFCKNLLKRQRHYKIVFYCRARQEYISSLLECRNCSKSILRTNKGIRKVGKKRVFVSRETYDLVFARDKGMCRLADKNCNGELNLHHIIYRSEDKSKINDVDNCIMLCDYHHRLVHSNKHYWQPRLKELVKEI